MDISYCPFCGKSVEPGTGACPECGSELPFKDVQLKVPAVSAILSAFFPGLGQMYNGDRLLKGLAIFFAFAVGSLFWFIPGLVVWIFGMYDAYRRADQMQKGIIEYTPASSRDLLLIVIIPLIFMLIVLAVTIWALLGIYGSTENLFYGIIR